MSYPKKCDRCEQFGNACFCEPADVQLTPTEISKLTDEAWYKLRMENPKALGIGVGVSSAAAKLQNDFEDEVGECLDRVRVGRGIS